MRTSVGYAKTGALNNMASASPFASIDGETGIPIAAGTVLGNFQEFDDVQALQYSSQGVVSVNLLTAGSGQTPGTYTVTASAGGAVMQYVVAAGGTVTAQPTILTPGGPYTDAATPTFTLPANGGTAATVQAVIGVLYSGYYQWVQLDPNYAGANILPGQPLWYVEGQSGLVVTPTSVAANIYDWAGTNIDPNFGPSLPYAFAQVGPGLHRVLNGASTLTLATDALTIDTTAGHAYYASTAVASAYANIYLGNPIATIAALSTGLARITRALARF